MTDTQTQLIQLSKTAASLSEFLDEACALLRVSYRSASIGAGLSHGTIWSLVSGAVKHGDTETIAELALFFGVPEVNLLRLAGYTPKYMSPDRFSDQVNAVFQSLTDEEKEEWVRYGILLIRARETKPTTS
jgi:hypothetical protein